MDPVTIAAPAGAALVLILLGLWVRPRSDDPDPPPDAWSSARMDARMWWFYVGLGAWVGLVTVLRLLGVVD